MQIKLFALISAATLAVARMTTVDEFVDAIDKFAQQGVLIQQEIDTVNNDTSIVSLYTFQSKYSLLLIEVEQMKDDLKAAPAGPVSVEDCDKVIQAFQTAQPTLNNALNTVASKKAFFDNLGFGRVTAVVLLFVQELQHHVDEIAKMVIALAPEQCIDEARALAAQYTATYDDCIAAFN